MSEISALALGTLKIFLNPHFVWDFSFEESLRDSLSYTYQVSVLVLALLKHVHFPVFKFLLPFLDAICFVVFFINECYRFPRGTKILKFK